MQSGQQAKLFVAVVVVALHLPSARSLKERRSWVRPLVEKLRTRYKVLVTEVGIKELYQRAEIAVCAMSTSEPELLDKIQRVKRTIDESWPGMILGWRQEVMEPFEGGTDGWWR